MQVELNIKTSGRGLYEITDQIKYQLQNEHITEGLATIFVRHTSCSLLIQENADPSAMYDLKNFFTRLVPDGDHSEMRWLTHIAEGPDDMPAHIKAALLPVSVSIPVKNNRLCLGTWQGIYLFEHRDDPHQRKVILHVLKG